jgi:rfaE bifunctional protein nucleotidyltransferase chain/domain
MTAAALARIIAPADLAAWRERLGVRQPVAVITGTFDILQPGNLHALIEAAALGPVCVVVEPDAVAAAHRPGGTLANDLAARAEFAAHLRLVSGVTSLAPAEAGRALDALRPFVWVTGGGADPYAAELEARAEGVVEVEPLAGCRTADVEAAIRAGRTPVALPAAFRGVDDAADAAALDAARRARGLATVNGCFDVLHLGHARFLAQARMRAQRLIVLLNDDASLRRYKGPDRPVFPLPFRLAALRALEAVDAVVAFPEDNPLRLIAELRPTLHLKGGTYEPDRVRQEQELLAQWGGRVEFCELVEGFSTTAYIRKALGG